MLVTEVEKVGFAVLIRTFPDAMELQHPAVLIRGIREFAFDIAEGCFVRLGARCDGKIEALRSGISKSGDEIRFTAVDYVYRESEFRKKYVNRAAMQDLCGYCIHSVRELALLNSEFPTIILSLDRKSTRLNSSHANESRMPSSA